MATPYQIRVSPRDTGLLAVEQDEAAAAKVSELLQKDLESHHVFFNDEGFHNHISHHLLTLYGTGASPAALQEAYDANTAYQLKAHEPTRGLAVVDELEADWPAHAPRYLGQDQHYADFLRYFQRRMERSEGRGGWEAVVKDHLLADTPAALDMRGRLYAGFLHPLIQLMYGIEWHQPAMVAEGLAQAAVHEARIGDFMAKVDDAAAASPPPAQQRPLAEMLEKMRSEHPKLAASARWEDPNRIYDGVLARAEPEAVALLAGIRVRPDDDLAERTAEMVHCAAYVAAAAACNPPYEPKFDFFLIHHLTSAPFFLTLNKLDWVPTASKARLLEWKLRMDVLQYLARGCPPLRREALQTPGPDSHDKAGGSHLVPRFHRVVDDGHTIKVVRALLLAQRESQAWPGRPWIRIADDDAWRRVMHLLLASVEGKPAQLWVRSAGFDEAWKDIPKASL
ncbi:oxidoreductase AflY [Hirsutella rhossiliensis]|uniref:Oxidoreductase AflY n=1 Tax=Hirsutella rhossiliensis TaxID=111463 RepID=A0A9P8N163_9HYPO|nr:oxidoreductase AflY [Hirsutella rhossiliensis]KAH0964965.1 oxidoreductase AflY [Hirsutella rhossiliensis]